MGIESLVEDFFSGLDVIVDDLLKKTQGDLLKSLRDIHHNTHNILRPNMGNADNWSWLSEYMIFHVFRRTIEKTIESKLSPKRLTPKCWVFEDSEEKFTLGHGVPLKQLLDVPYDNLWDLKPDICLVHRNRIILTVEVKTAVKKKKALIRDFNKLTWIQERFSKKRPPSRAFFVSYASTLKVTPDENVVGAYKEFHKAKGRFVGRVDDDSSIEDNTLFSESCSRRRMKLISLEVCLKRVKELLEKLH